MATFLDSISVLKFIRAYAWGALPHWERSKRDDIKGYGGEIKRHLAHISWICTGLSTTVVEKGVQSRYASIIISQGAYEGDR